jgi:hypothetical protein
MMMDGEKMEKKDIRLIFITGIIITLIVVNLYWRYRVGVALFGADNWWWILTFG